MSEKAKLNVSEHAEPAAGNTQMPVSVMVVLTLLGYIGCYKVDNLNANFASNVHAPFGSPEEVASLAPSEEELVFSQGKQLYANCQGCHQSNGGGTPGTFPPLAGSDWVMGDPQRIAAVVLNGLGGEVVVSGKTYNNQMTPVGETWSDEQVAAVLTYIRKEWGNSGGRVFPDAVSQARAKTKESGQAGPWTEATLNAAFPAE
jgi:mono/diheme cytochrome c family protein